MQVAASPHNFSRAEGDGPIIFGDCLLILCLCVMLPPEMVAQTQGKSRRTPFKV